MADPCLIASLTVPFVNMFLRSDERSTIAHLLARIPFVQSPGRPQLSRQLSTFDSSR